MDSGSTFQLIEAISSASAGPAPKFDKYHLLKLLLVLSREGCMGRSKMSKTLSVGEGTVRTIIYRMKRAGLLSESKKGCALTPVGLEIARAISTKISCIAAVPADSFEIEGEGVGVLVKGGSPRIDAVKLRDEAIKGGAKALITLVRVGGKLVMPSVENDVIARWPKAGNAILATFNPSEGDVILVAVSEDPLKAERGALMAAWFLAFKV
ncbi:MAG: DUF4443 domain-containing protein [Candidatus Nezhaarchaeota archaeon]|nr:DUF4443 domain-containing protein [Candidatus Nezhaarchaeota archaeon]